MNHSPKPKRYLEDAQIEGRWGVSSGFLSELRTTGAGPPYVRFSKRTVRYAEDVIEEFEQTHTFQSLAEEFAAKTPPPAPPAPSRVAKKARARARAKGGCDETPATIEMPFEEGKQP
jgi:hypothetical protein